MRLRASLIALVIVSLFAASPAWAQQHVVSQTDLRQAMTDKAAADEASRDLVLSVLRHDAARDVAERLSLDLTRAEQAVATLDAEQLASAAASARAVDAELSGEATYVTLSLTALLLIVILILLID